jgi:hypothetical protein
MEALGFHATVPTQWRHAEVGPEKQLQFSIHCTVTATLIARTTSTLPHGPGGPALPDSPAYRKCPLCKGIN